MMPSRYSDRRTTSWPVAVAGTVSSTPTLRSATSSPPRRTITSSWSVGACGAACAPGPGRCTSRMLVFENTAVKIRKNARITITSSIGTMFRSLRPR